MLNTTVVNMGDEPIEVDVRKEGEIAEWIVVSSSAFNMSGREEKTITFTLSVPQTDLEPGDHYCYIVVVGYPANVSGGDVGVRVGNGIRLTAWVQLPGEVVKSGEIIQFKAPDVERGQIAEFEVTFQATGTVHVDAFPKVWISRDNAVVDVVEGGKVMVMPGETKKLTAKWNTTGAALGGISSGRQGFLRQQHDTRVQRHLHHRSGNRRDNSVRRPGRSKGGNG